jgi:hypothetical protein
MNQYIITEEQIEEFGDYVEDDDNHTEEKYKNARGLAGKIRSHPYNPQAERKEYLGKIALRMRHEFAQDDNGEWYLCADDFGSVFNELNQEIEDEAELRQSKDGEP